MLGFRTWMVVGKDCRESKVLDLSCRGPMYIDLSVVFGV